MTDETLNALVVIDAQPAKLDANFEQLQQALQERLSQYETVVSEDGVKAAKASATEINKLKGELAKRRKAAADDAKAPIRDFEDRMKSLEGQCEEARRMILDQVDQYEDRRREIADERIRAERDRQWERFDVDEDHRRATCDDLVKLGALTAKDNLTKATAVEIERRCQADRERQNMVSRRLLELEARSYRAGLSAPLTRDHIHQWLEADEETYERELSRILEAEVARQEQAERRMREQMEREARQRQEHERAEQERRAREQAQQERASADPTPESPRSADVRPMPPAATDDPESASTPETPGDQPESTEEGTEAVAVTCLFRTAVPTWVTDDMLKSEVRRRLAAAGFTSLDAVTVERPRKAA
ncbi:DUF1351 domain-containing protein [Arhodomonas sp. AD133]|uniref:DUF1351 domain-containing protein n=1 Tax=Arhodomonas sp. AD133 TaxID=3415009 RepID=UPI003EBC4AB1